MVAPEQLTAARALKPMQTRHVFGREILLFDLSADLPGSLAERNKLASLGELRTPSIGDLFVAVMGKTQGMRTQNLDTQNLDTQNLGTQNFGTQNFERTGAAR